MAAILHDEGEQLMLDVFLRGATPPAGFYIGLCSGTPAETTTLTGLTGEPSGNGYARVAVERSNVGWPTLSLNSGDYQATSKTVTFTCSTSAWAAVTKAFLATSSDNTGKLIASVDLSTSRTLQVGDNLQVTFNLKEQ